MSAEGLKLQSLISLTVPAVESSALEPGAGAGPPNIFFLYLSLAYLVGHSRLNLLCCLVKIMWFYEVR